MEGIHGRGGSVRRTWCGRGDAGHEDGKDLAARLLRCSRADPDCLCTKDSKLFRPSSVAFWPRILESTLLIAWMCDLNPGKALLTVEIGKCIVDQDTSYCRRNFLTYFSTGTLQTNRKPGNTAADGTAASAHQYHDRGQSGKMGPIDIIHEKCRSSVKHLNVM